MPASARAPRRSPEEEEEEPPIKVAKITKADEQGEGGERGPKMPRTRPRRSAPRSYAISEEKEEEGGKEGEQEEEGGREGEQEEEGKEEENTKPSPPPKKQHQQEQEQHEEGKGAEPQDPTKGIIEEGRISFFYRPKVSVSDPSSVQDIQRFYILFSPSKKEVAKARLAIVGKKRLPEPSKKERIFGFIEAVSDNPEQLIKSSLGEREYETKTRGTRHLQAARAVGEGVYSIVEHHGKGGHTHLTYKLEQPEQPMAVQEDLKISKQGSFVFQVKNPQNKPPTGGRDPGLEEKAEFSEEKQEEFGGYAWIPVRDSQLLCTERAEFLMVGVGEKVGEEVGELAHDEDYALEEMKREGVVESGPVETGEWK